MATTGLRHEGEFFRPLWIIVSAIVVSALFVGCHKASHPSVTLAFLDPEWSHDLERWPDQSKPDPDLDEFARETGIRVKRIPAPETSPAQLALTESLLRKKSPSPDVYGVDVIWPGMLSAYLVDLRPSLSAEMATQDPEVLKNYTVRGGLVAAPYHANIAVLYYRTDLLSRYGYREPPATWDELEGMALRIQEGERKRGQPDFCGFVWPGAASEGLMCNALEWQADEGGGTIVEPNQTVSVDNREAIEAWERAARWIEKISPPSVTSYQEWDVTNSFWSLGKAAFAVRWISDYFISHPPEKLLRDDIGITSLPRGKVARLGTLGGFGLGVSKSSAHIPEAIELVRFLIRQEEKLDEARRAQGPPPHPILDHLPKLLRAYSMRSDSDAERVVLRPSTVTGAKYRDVSEAYVRTVHGVLTGQMQAPEAAKTLQSELVRITGFRSRDQRP